MKINEAFEGLLKNKNSVYESGRGDYRSELSLCEVGYFYLKIYNDLGEEIDSSLGGGGFNGNITAEDEWELARQPVDFMTAANSGGKIKPVDDSAYSFHKLGYWSMTLENINSNWLIE